MNKEMLVLITSQLIKDKISLIEMHERLIQQLGDSSEAEEYVYKEYLGEYIEKLKGVINNLILCIQNDNYSLSMQDIAIITAQLQKDKNQINRILEETERNHINIPEAPVLEYERYILWESNYMDVLFQNFLYRSH